MKVFITGSTGFVGSHVARAYEAEGAQLRLLTRSTSNLEALRGLAAETVVGDLRRPEELRVALTGCDALVHVAADYRLWVRNPEAMHEANVVGTRELLRLAREVGVPRVVYTSSVATMGFRSDGTIVDEATPVALTDMIGHYKRSKFLAEQEAIRAAQDGQHVILLNPTTPIGPGDAKPTPTGRIVVDFLNRKFPAYVDTGLNLVDVSEVARMHVAALQRGTPGERYILGGENLTLKQILDRMSAITGLPSPTLKVPHTVAMAFAFFEETITGKLRGKEPRATVEAVRMGRKMMFASSAKAERQLGFRVLPVYTALRAAIEWFVAHDYAPRPAQGCARMRIAIIAALPGELKHLVSTGFQGAPCTQRHARKWVMAMGDDEWVAVCAGIGADAARRAFTEVEAGGKIDMVLSVGWAGALAAGLIPGASYVASSVVDARTGERFELAGGVRDAVLVTSAAVALEREKRRLAQTYGAKLVDMEAAVVVRLAQMRGIPVICIKAVSDDVGDVLPDLTAFIDAEGQMRMPALIAYVLAHPKYWRPLRRLGRSSSEGAKSLASQILTFLTGPKDVRQVIRTGNVDW